MRIRTGQESDYARFVELNSTDGYSRAVVVYAERWAGLMEERLAEGIAKIAKETSHLADTDGISGFMYGCAVSALSTYWEHGEELRRWHNIATQIQHEGEEANAKGGVLNPAVLVIGAKP